MNSLFVSVLLAFLVSTAASAATVKVMTAACPDKASEMANVLADSMVNGTQIPTACI